SIGAYGMYRVGRNGLGVLHEVTINARHLDRPKAEILTTLFHELLHLWQTLYGKSSRGNYHNRQFRDKAGLYGLIINDHGYTSVEPGRFTTLLAKNGVGAESVPTLEKQPLRNRPRGSSKMRKYR